MIDTQTKEIIRSYKSNQASKYIPVRGDEILTRIFDCEKYHISTKHDGHLCFIIKNETDLMISNFNGELFDRPDLILEITNLLETESGVFVGEIYNYKESERSRSFDLVKNISDPKSIIKIAVFDIISNGDTVFEFGDWEEKRTLINLGYSIDLYNENDIIVGFPFFAQLTNTRLQRNYIEVNGQTYNIYHGQIGQSNTNPGGTGAGLGIGLTGSVKFNKQFSFMAGYYAQYSKINMNDNLKPFGLHHSIFARIIFGKNSLTKEAI